MNVQNVRNAISRLEAINPLDEYAYERAVRAFINIQRLPILICHVPADERICRTRTDETFQLHTKATDISTPPLKYVTTFARCNRPFQPKFYGSESRIISFFELVENWVDTRKAGDKIYVTVGAWHTKAPLHSLIITSPDKEKRLSKFDKTHGWALDEFLQAQETETREALILLYEFLFNRFRKPAKHDLLTYIITTAYCNVMLSRAQEEEQTRNANSVWYPSVPAKEQGVNFAINSPFIEAANIYLGEVVCSELTITDSLGLKFDFTETNKWEAKEVKANGEIVW